MTTFPVIRFAVAAWAAAYAVSAASADVPVEAVKGPTVKEMAKAEEVFKDVYGKAYDKAAVAKMDDRLAFVKKLLGSAGEVKDDPALRAVVLGKALKLAGTTPAGLKAALEVHAAMAADPWLKAEHAGDYAVALEKRWRRSRRRGRRRPRLTCWRCIASGRRSRRAGGTPGRCGRWPRRRI